MIETQIPKKDVLRLFENNGFDFNEETHELVYEDERGVKRGFPLPWLKDDETALYDLGSVRKLLGKMMATVKLSQTIMDAANDKAFMDEVGAAIKEFGMAYDEENDLFVYHVPGQFAFTAPLDYIVSTVLHKKEELKTVAKQNKAEANFDKLSTKDLVLLVLDSMKVDAQESQKEKVQDGSTEKEQEA